MQWIYDLLAEIRSFARRVDRGPALPALVLLKAVEWAIYRWYRAPVRRVYGVRSVELVYRIAGSGEERLPLDRFLGCLRRIHPNLHRVTVLCDEPAAAGEDLLRIAGEARALGVPVVLETEAAPLPEELLRRFAARGGRLVAPDRSGGFWRGVGGTGAGDRPCAARGTICVYPNGDVVRCFEHRRIPIAREPLGNLGREDILDILGRRRAARVSLVMGTCDLPCKQRPCGAAAPLPGDATP